MLQLEFYYPFCGIKRTAKGYFIVPDEASKALQVLYKAGISTLLNITREYEYTGLQNCSFLWVVDDIRHELQEGRLIEGWTYRHGDPVIPRVLVRYCDDADMVSVRRMLENFFRHGILPTEEEKKLYFEPATILKRSADPLEEYKDVLHEDYLASLNTV